MYIWLFSRSEGAGSATRRNTRGLTRSVIALIVPPLPAPSRPSNSTITRAPSCFTHSCRWQSSTCSARSSFSYSFRFSRLPFSFAFFMPLSSLGLVLLPGQLAHGPVSGSGDDDLRPHAHRQLDRFPERLCGGFFDLAYVRRRRRAGSHHLGPHHPSGRASDRVDGGDEHVRLALESLAYCVFDDPSLSYL